MGLALLLIVFLICIVAVAAFVFPPSKIVDLLKGEKRINKNK